jgi:gamma-glutamyl:cysteine ligase YbdK (ATP-grasp superfamily)
MWNTDDLPEFRSHTLQILFTQEGGKRQLPCELKWSVTKSTMPEIPIPKGIDAILTIPRDQRTRPAKDTLASFYRSVAPSLKQERTYLNTLQKQLRDVVQ